MNYPLPLSLPQRRFMAGGGNVSATVNVAHMSGLTNVENGKKNNIPCIIKHSIKGKE